MLGRLVRIVLGLAMAALAAGLVKVLYVITPAELISLSGDALERRLEDVGTLTLLTATHSAIFAAPFALGTAVFGEWLKLRSPVFYILAGVVIALAGFLVQYSSEATGQPTVVNNYALNAFLGAGFFGGLVYWLIGGRLAGGSAYSEPPVQPDAGDATRSDGQPATA